MGQLTIHVHYTTFVVTEKQSQLGMAVNPGVLCTLNARNELSQHRVHEKQTATLLHATLHYTDLPACVQRTPRTSQPKLPIHSRPYTPLLVGSGGEVGGATLA